MRNFVIDRIYYVSNALYTYVYSFISLLKTIIPWRLRNNCSWEKFLISQGYSFAVLRIRSIFCRIWIRIRGFGFKNLDPDPSDPKKAGSDRIRILLRNVF